MRIAVLGASRVLPALTGLLEHEGYRVVGADQGESYTITVDDGPGPSIVVDIPDALFGRVVTHAIGGFAGGVFVKHRGGNQNDRAVVVTVPPDDGSAQAVERGLVRALALVQQMVGQTVRQKALTAGTQTAGDVGGVIPQLLATWDELNHALITEVAKARAEAGTAHGAHVAAMTETRLALCDQFPRLATRLEQAISHATIRATADNDRLIALWQAHQDRRRWWQVWR